MTNNEWVSLLAFRRKKDVKVINNHNRIVQDDWTLYYACRVSANEGHQRVSEDQEKLIYSLWKR